MLEQPLVGREAAVELIENAIEAAFHGRGGCLVLEAPSGFGKTRALKHAARFATAAGARVVQGQATRLDQLAPLSTLTTTLGICGGPFEAQLEQGAGNTATIGRLRARLGELVSEGRPLLVAIDDMQRCDDLSALALRILVPSLLDRPVLWLLARRPSARRDQAHDALDALFDSHAQRIELPLLHQDSVHRLCRELVDGQPGDRLLSLVEHARGHPFLVSELVHSLDRGGRIHREGTLAELAEGQDSASSDGELPPAFVTAVCERLIDLSPGARKVLEAGTVLGEPFTVHEAAGLLTDSVNDVLRATDEAVTSGYLVEGEPGLTFRDCLTRQAVYASLSTSARRALHREAAAIVGQEGRPPSQVAEHLLLGGPLNRQAALDAVSKATAELFQESPDAAADLTIRLLDKVDGVDQAAASLLADTMRTLACLGRADDARALGERVLHRVDDATAGGMVLRELTELLGAAGDSEAIIEHTRRVLAQAGIPDAVRAELLAEQAHALTHTSAMADAAEPARYAVEIAQQEGLRAVAARASLAGSMAARVRGELGASYELARCAVEAADAAELPVRYPRMWLASALVALDKFAEAEATLSLCEGANIYIPRGQWLLRLRTAQLHLAAGELDKAAAASAAGLSELEPNAPVCDSIPLFAVAAEVATLRGEFADAEQHLDAAFERAHRSGTRYGEVAWRKALLLEAKGQLDAAVRTAASYPITTSHLDGLVADSLIGPATMVRLAVRGGATEQARALALGVRTLAESNHSVASLVAAATHVEGLVSGDPAMLTRAVDLYRYSPRPLALATALEDAGAALLERDQPHGEQMRTEAAAIWSAANAKRARNEPDPDSHPRFPGASGDAHEVAWRTLTPAELRVVRLVAEGMTNRAVASALVVSPHTVDSHLRRSFEKLNVTNRVELTRLYLAAQPPSIP
ncbi:AAA family ATPase [Pseudonocardia sp.]|uniref:AAA family ATPase n=1 Tax=Pseudonocardia sp. TaxID=60912 RepID=UPI002F3FCF2B